jgi:hypothetical protein
MTVSPLHGYRRHSVEQRALDLMSYLQENEEGATRAEISEALQWSPATTRSAIKYARTQVCREFGVTIPQPVPDDGYKYHLTGEWIRDDGMPAIEAGTSFAMGQVESRLRSIHRDVQVARMNLDPRSIPGRKANFLDKRLGYIFETLASIGRSTPYPVKDDDGESDTA